MSTVAEQAKDELRAAAWKLASVTTRGNASQFLEDLSRELSDADWRRK